MVNSNIYHKFKPEIERKMLRIEFELELLSLIS